MKEEKYFNEISEIIENYEVNKKVREIKDNIDELNSRWEIGRLIFEAQGGEERAKYGNYLIKIWSKDFTMKYGNGYSERNMLYMRKFYQTFPIPHTLCAKLTWSHYRNIIPLKNENERNYYINQVILNNLSVRELRNEIKNNAFDRLSYADKDNIKLIDDSNNNKLTIEDMIKDPIIINTVKDISSLDEKAIHKLIIEMVEKRFLELGAGFTLAGHEYKLKVDNRVYKIDLLFFNVKLNCYIPVEIKNREVNARDVGQIELYTELIDKYLKENSNNKSIGLLLVRKKNKIVIEHITNKENIFLSTLKLV